MPILFYILGTTLILSCLLDLRVKDTERLLSFGLVRVLLALPFLTGVYLYTAVNLRYQLVAPLFFSENVLAVIWLLTAYRMHNTVLPATAASKLYKLSFAVAGITVVASGGYWLLMPPPSEILEGVILFPSYGQLYLSSLFTLMAVFFMVWRLEVFWRALNPKERRQYTYLVIGLFLVCGCLFWLTSYRLLFRRQVVDHYWLACSLVFIAWLFILYGVARHRLLNRKLFVSRKVVYSAAAPVVFAGYLILLGFASLVMRAFGWSLHHVFQWLLVLVGLLIVVVLLFSEKVRSAVRYFVSTHFYVNKYEYRDEWLAFTNLLKSSLTEADVAEALRRILSESLYTRRIMIWLGDAYSGFRLIDRDKNNPADAVVTAGDPLVLYLQQEPYFYLDMPVEKEAWRYVSSVKRDFFLKNGLVLVVPITVGGQYVGLIGLGPEYTGGRYGPDDFDLLAALGSQAALAVLAARAAEKRAQTREMSAWNTLAAFVLHDIKNAAAILNLIRENAPAHIHKPEFQQDLLASIDDALKRMKKVQGRLNVLKGSTMPAVETVEIGRFVKECCQKLDRKLPELSVKVQCNQDVSIQTDPEIVTQILENLLLNAHEAVGTETLIHITVANADYGNVRLEINDNGPGIPAELLPDRLFEPFTTCKPNGSGIGLWQARRLVESLGGTIGAENLAAGGAKFVVQLPIGRAAS